METLFSIQDRKIFCKCHKTVVRGFSSSISFYKSKKKGGEPAQKCSRSRGLESLFGWEKQFLLPKGSKGRTAWIRKGKPKRKRKTKIKISMPVRNCIHFLCNLNQVFLNVLQTRGTLKKTFSSWKIIDRKKKKNNS